MEVREIVVKKNDLQQDINTLLEKFFAYLDSNGIGVELQIEQQGFSLSQSLNQRVVVYIRLNDIQTNIG